MHKLLLYIDYERLEWCGDMKEMSRWRRGHDKHEDDSLRSFIWVLAY